MASGDWIDDFDRVYGGGQGYDGPPVPFSYGGPRYDPTSYVPPWLPPPPRVVLPPPVPQPLEPQPDEEDLDMAHDWGHVFRQATGGLVGSLFGGGGASAPFSVPNFPTSDPVDTGNVAPSAVAGGLGPEACEGMIWTGAAPPKGYKVVNWCGRGVLRKVRRRRRRRILTASDKADISYIISTAGKGQLAASLIHKSTH